MVGDCCMGWKQGVSGHQVLDGERPPFIELAEVFVAWLCSSDAGGKLEMKEEV